MRDRRLDAKLERFDARAQEAVLMLRALLRDRPDDLIAVARGRHVWGHYRYGDRNFAEWSPGEVRAAIIEELADGIVYAAHYLAMTSEEDQITR